MTSYYDEHNCLPLPSGQNLNPFVRMARLILDSDNWQQIEEEFIQLFGYEEKPPPPASKEFVKNLPHVIMEEKAGSQCAVCLKEWGPGEEGTQLPCSHTFHGDCILPWLTHASSCPLCRLELPTDDPEYEDYKKQKKRAKEREAELEILHDSMYS